MATGLGVVIPQPGSNAVIVSRSMGTRLIDRILHLVLVSLFLLLDSRLSGLSSEEEAAKECKQVGEPAGHQTAATWAVSVFTAATASALTAEAAFAATV